MPFASLSALRPGGLRRSRTSLRGQGLRCAAEGLLFLVAAGAAWAQPAAPALQEASRAVPGGELRRLYVSAGRGVGDVGLFSAGVQVPWPWRHSFAGGELTGHWDAHIAHWRAPAGATDGARRQWAQVALVPTLRLRFDGGRSAWFMEGGIGVSVLDGHYATQRKAFSTRFNFTDHEGVGFHFGDRRQHELMLALRHVSNGGLRAPNPGENFVQIRYGVVF